MNIKNNTRKTVMVTGASRGIGRAIAARYFTTGAHVVTPGRHDMDLASPAAIKTYVDAHPEISPDILINCAGINKVSPIRELELADFEHVMATNLTAAFLLIRYVAEGMAFRGWGRIVNISSCYSLVGREGRLAYSASKSALNALTRSAALEYATAGVLVNSVCPGFIDTEMTIQNNNPSQIEAICQQIPLKRLGKPDEVANFVHYLGSEANTYITGQTMVIDGGFMIH